MRVQTAIVFCCLSLTALSAGAAFTSGPVVADDKAPGTNAGKRASEQGLVVQVFRLKRANLESVEEKVRSMLPADEPATPLGQPASPSPTGGIAGGGNGALGALGGGGFPGFGMLGFNGGALGGGHLPGTQLGIGGGISGSPGGIGGSALGALGIGGGISGSPGGIGGISGLPNAGALGVPAMPAGLVHAQPATKWRMVTDERTHSLIFRGSPENAQTVSEIVALADLGAGDPLPRVQRVAAFQLKHAQAGPLVEKLNQLELDVRLGSLEPSNIVIAIGSTTAKKELAELIKALDVELKPQ